ncbi:aldo/keto reductase [Shewanella psychrotolerans]|uniref:aldo/keto reductase n=1 Tax=Shewanella psychrotolerans TaxID=2864206 RepID=UPI001C65770C|nr:aldo/keto reductase [Shewanella psychrotolerans]QYK01838.1 aldo/keto reductase [Shewanella psychrotolerans]
MSQQSFTLSPFIAGFWRLDSWQQSPQQTLALIEHYLSLGVTCMDHADIYGEYSCENLFGRALALKPSLRQQMQIVTKCGIKPAFASTPDRYINYYDTSYQHILSSVDNSLRALQVEEIDLLLIHRPDPLMNADEVAQAFEQLYQTGKVKHFGVSNFTPSQFDLLQSRLERPLVTNQLEISPMQLSALHDGTLDHCQQYRCPPMAWSCLGGGGIFTGSSAQAIRLRETLTQIAKAHDTDDISQIIYAWVLALPSQPKPIIGSGNLDRISAAVTSKQIVLDKQEWFSIWQASTGHSVP